jgi:hypothetical protein
MNWIDINKEQPEWYTNVELKVGGKIKQHCHRVTDGDVIYYGSLKDSSIIYEKDVTYWRLLDDTI